MKNGPLFSRVCIILSLLTLPIFAAWVKVNDETEFTAIYEIGNRIVLASEYQNVYRSTDGGASWTRLAERRKTCFLKTDSGIFAGSVGDGIWKSMDSGLTWKSVYTYQGSPNVYALTKMKNRLIAGTDYGLYYSDNNGLKWTLQGIGINDSVRTLYADDSVLLATTLHGNCAQSMDSGKTWSPFQYLAAHSLTSLQGVYYAASDNAGVLRSEDKGKTWKSVFLGSRFKRIDFIGVHDGKIFAGNSEGIFYSSDNGLNWTEFSDSGHQYYGGTQILVGDFIYFGGEYSLKGEYRSSIAELLAISEKESLGPDTTHWLQTKGPPGGGVTSFTEFNNTLFSGSYDGVYKAVNDGDSWVKVFKFGRELSANEKFLFAAGDDIFRTSDLNRGWTDINTGQGGGFGNATLRRIGPLLYTGGRQTGVSWSGDDGASWWTEEDGLESYFVTSFDTLGGSLRVGSSDGLYRRNDQDRYVVGKDRPPYWIEWGLDRQIQCLASNNTKHFAGTSYGLYELKDTTTGWRLVPDTALARMSIYSLLVMGDTIFVGGKNLYRSVDDGVTWKSLLPSVNNQGVGSIHIYRGKIFVGTSGSNYRSGDNGVSWVKINTGLANSDIRSLKVFNGVLYALDYNNGAYKSSNSGETWTDISAGLPQDLIFCLGSTVNGLYAATWKGVFQLNESGSGWVSRSAGLGDSNCTALGAIGDILFVGTRDGGVFRSLNGAGWSAAGLSNIAVNSLTNDGPVLYAGTSKGVFYSGNNGASWTPCGPQEYPIRDVAVFGNTLVSSTDSGFYRSTDHGKTWTPPLGWSEPSSVQALGKIGPYLLASVYNSSDQRSTVYQSKDSGATWSSADTGLYQDRNSSGATSFAANGDYYFAGTHLHGVWRRPLAYLGPVRALPPGDQSADALQLRINTRGKYSRLLSVEFKLPQAEQVIINAYDLTGKRFDICAGKNFKSGWNSVPWSTQNLARGIFIVQLRAGALSKSRTIVIDR